MNIIKYQLVGEARYSDLKEQLWFDVVIEQCHLAPLWAWDKIEEPGERSTSFTKIAQGSGEAFTDYLQSLVSAINKAVSDPDVRQMVIEILAFENGNNECKRVIRPLKVQTAPMDKCIRDMTHTGSHEYHTNIIGKYIARVSYIKNASNANIWSYIKKM